MQARRNPWLTAAVVAAAAVLPFFLPRCGRWRPVSSGHLRETFLDPFTGRARFRLWEPVPAAPLPARNPVVKPDAAAVPGPQDRPGGAASARAPRAALLPPDPAAADLLSDPAGALRHFHESLARTRQGDGSTRIVHLGDSVVTGDLITGEARARLQQAFGDGGPGWIYPQRPWEWYGRLGLTLKGQRWRIQSPALGGRPDHAYGLAGIGFSSAGGAETTLSIARPQAFDLVELHYLAQPRGGTISLQAEHGVGVEVSTEGETGPASKALQLPVDGARELKVRAQGEAVLYGVVLERRGAGVIYDPLGQNGYAIQHLARIDRNHWIQALRLRRPDLVVLGFGTNEVGYYNIPGPAYAADYREVVRRIREALPATSILVMGPMDRGERKADGEPGSMPNLIRIVEAQKKIAAELGVAFFDCYRAMGGEGSAMRWYAATPRLMTGDFTHPTRSGADRIAKSFVDALLLRQQAWTAVRPAAPADGGRPPSGPPAAPRPN